jgi:type IV pilus assembly protein PilW
MIELLVAVVIAMLVGLAAFSSAAAFGAAQRQAVSAGATSAELANALSALKTEISVTSLGFVVGGVNRCTSWNLIDGPVTYNDAPVLPLRIERDASTGLDRLDVVLPGDVKAAATVLLAANASPSASSVALRGWLAVQPGQMIMLAPREPGVPCTVRTVTGTVDAVPGANPFTLQLAPASFTSLATYTPEHGVSVLGRLDRRRIEVTSGNLVTTGTSLAAPVVLAENVVGWRAQYGVADASGSIAWSEPVGPWAAPTPEMVARVTALRLAVMARSPQREKQCSATTALPQLLGATIDVAAADPTGWQCYRYRRAEIVIPLRNAAWVHT